MVRPSHPATRSRPVLSIAGALMVVLALASAAAGDGEGGEPAPVPPPESRPPESPPPELPPPERPPVEWPPAEPPKDALHGDFTLRSRSRWTDGEKDLDLYQYLNLRWGDENRDPVSAVFSAHAAEDVDGQGGVANHVYSSLADTYDHGFLTFLDVGYAAFRPSTGPFETARLGRQYVYGAGTFQVDGASATTRPLEGAAGARLTGFGGVPVHPYEKSPSGDWIAGLGAEGRPWEGGRAALDWVHVEDRLSQLSAGDRERDDLESVALWQAVGGGFDLHGRFSWMQGPRDAYLRVTWALPEERLLVQGSAFRLLERAEQSTTEFDPYSAVLSNLERYQTLDLRATKGFGEYFDLEAGGSSRRLLPGEADNPFNRDTNRYYVTPSVTDVPWKGLSFSATGERWSGANGSIRTWAADLTQRFPGGTRISIESDYSLYALGVLGAEERTDVRVTSFRVRAPLSRLIVLDAQYTWEKDDKERFHAVKLSIEFAF